MMLLTAAAQVPSLVVTPPANAGYFYDLLRRWGASDFTAKTGQWLISRPLEILLITVAAWLVARIGSRLVRRTMKKVAHHTRDRDETNRTSGRMQTIGQTVSSLFKAVVWFIAGLMILSALGINLAPLLAGATVVGAAIAFGAQNVIRDILSGFFLFVEDQFGIGDSITIGDLTGVVEDFHLRVTQLRGADGEVWYIPNGEIRKLGNTSLPGRRALVDIRLPPGSDLQLAIASIEDTLGTFGDLPTKLVGVISSDEAAVTVRVTCEAGPGDAGEVSMDLRRAIAVRLARENIYPKPS